MILLQQRRRLFKKITNLVSKRLLLQQKNLNTKQNINMAQKQPMHFIDIGANLLDDMFQGIYRGKTLHARDLKAVLTRASTAGCSTIFVTAGTIEESKKALELCQSEMNSLRRHGDGNDTVSLVLKTTIGIHPTNASLYDGREKSSILEEMLTIATKGKQDKLIVAIGECGLDRLREKDFSPFATQESIWKLHFDLANMVELPMFIHSRDCETETLQFLKEFPLKRGGVVHSFDGSIDFAKQILALADNLYIGINGCSLRTQENLETIKVLPIERILVESDSPWCEIKPTSAAYTLLEKDRWDIGEVNKPEKLKGQEGKATVKNRNEPKNTLDVLRVIAVLKEMPLEIVSRQILENTKALFGEDVLK